MLLTCPVCYLVLRLVRCHCASGFTKASHLSASHASPSLSHRRPLARARNLTATVAAQAVSLQHNAWRPRSFDQPRSWSPEYPYYEAPNRPGQNECPEECCGVSKANQAWYCKWRVKPGGNNWLQDQNATYVLQQRMREAAAKYKSDGTPFFAALGLHKPHLVSEDPRGAAPFALSATS